MTCDQNNVVFFYFTHNLEYYSYLTNLKNSYNIYKYFNFNILERKYFSELNLNVVKI